MRPCPFTHRPVIRMRDTTRIYTLGGTYMVDIEVLVNGRLSRPSHRTRDIINRFSCHWPKGGRLSRSLQHEAQPMEVVQATAPTQPQVKALLEKLPHYFPIPVGQFNSRLSRRILHRRLQLVLLTPVQDGGEPPVCSKTKPWAPPRRKLASQFPMV